VGREQLSPLPRDLILRGVGWTKHLSPWHGTCGTGTRRVIVKHMVELTRRYPRPGRNDLFSLVAGSENGVPAADRR